MLRRRWPARTEQPDRRKKAAEVVRFIRSYMGRTTIARWEFSPAGTIVLYFEPIHHEPGMTAQTLPRLILASEKFNFPFRLFGDGNLIAMEILEKI